MIYLNNAATSWPKPESVYKAVDACLRQATFNPGRSNQAHAQFAGAFVDEARSTLGRLIGAAATQIIWTRNATEAINLALKGLLNPGDHVITSQMEHHAVFRPLQRLVKLGVEVETIETDPASGISLSALEKALRANTRLVVLCHASNVLGTINPIALAGLITRSKGIPLLVDAAQTAGILPIDVKQMNISMLAMAGHKSLLGPQGTGALYFEEGLELRPLIEGGTGSYAEQWEQPLQIPDRYESGTLNLPGIAGLGAGLQFIADTGLAKIRSHENRLVEQFINGLSKHPRISISGPPPSIERASVVSFSIDGWDPQDVATILDDTFDIVVRAGLHCAPSAHQLAETLPKGSVRISPGFFNTPEQIENALEAVLTIARS